MLMSGDPRLRVDLVLLVCVVTSSTSVSDDSSLNWLCASKKSWSSGAAGSSRFNRVSSRVVSSIWSRNVELYSRSLLGVTWRLRLISLSARLLCCSPSQSARSLSRRARRCASVSWSSVCQLDLARAARWATPAFMVFRMSSVCT